MKNAIYNHGDISVAVNAEPMQVWIPSEDVSWPHFLGKHVFHLFSLSLSSPYSHSFSLASTDYLLKGIIQ